MSYSWSKKLFLKINSLVGQNKARDQFFHFIANWLLFILGLIVLSWGNIFLEPMAFKYFVKLLTTAIVLSMVIGRILGLIWKHPRPIIEFPQIKELFKPLENWRSFPSDHTAICFIYAFLVLVSSGSLWFFVLLTLLASLVGFSRIYVGVHYPRDIVGGIASAAIFVWAAPYLVKFITEPIYFWFINLLK